MTGRGEGRHGEAKREPRFSSGDLLLYLRVLRFHAKNKSGNLKTLKLSTIVTAVKR